MTGKKYRKSLALIVAVICTLVWCEPARAISIKEEQQLSQEFMRVVNRYYALIDDPLIVDYVDSVGRKILRQMPPQPFPYKFHVIKEDVYNAFAIPAGYIFVNSGLLLAMNSEDELAGILSHEISHVVCRHISQRIDRSKKIDLASMAGLVAGIFLGAAGGGAAAAQALTLGSVAAGQTLTLAYSREDESQADQVGLPYMVKAGYSPEGLLDILKKIRSKQWFGSSQIPTYMMTHPAVEERIASIDSWMATQRKTAPSMYTAPHPSEHFKRIQYRLRALYGEPESAVRYFKSGLAQHPSDPDLAYGMGLTLTRTNHYTEAVAYLQQALAQNALDPVILADLGKVYFLDGRLNDALRILKGAASLNGPNPEGLFYLGRTYMELSDYKAAADAFESLLQIQEDYAPTYYFLGETYGKLNRIPETHFFLGMYHFKKGEDRIAYYHLIRAQKSVQDPTKLEAIKQALEIIGKLPPEEQQQDR